MPEEVRKEGVLEKVTSLDKYYIHVNFTLVTDSACTSAPYRRKN